jgi:hypothetical protein
LNYSPNRLIRAIKSKGMKQTWHVARACRGEMRNKF